MPKPDESSERALRRLDKRLDKFEASRAPKTPALGSMAASGDGYRILAEMLGGVFGGLGLGWLLDRVAHTSPWGLVSGLLIGSGVSVYAAVRTALAMSARASQGSGPASSAPDDEEDE
ncbi:MAG: AtpZ/AtpI family protein [Proteobacteria bacterium]|nr:AtpZ/AtpI family protein [Pseudomonadota bacterium]